MRFQSLSLYRAASRDHTTADHDPFVAQLARTDRLQLLFRQSLTAVYGSFLNLKRENRVIVAKPSGLPTPDELKARAEGRGARKPDPSSI